MKYNFLGKTGKRISVIGFGCMSLQPGAEKENETLLRKAFDNDINFFDTADLYDKGTNEMQVGKALRDVRTNLMIATKVGNQWRTDGSGWDWNPRKEYIIQAAEASLKRLQTDYIDLYQLHGGTIDDPIEETIEAFELLKQQGKILHYGISSIRPNVIREYVQRSNIVSVMMQYSMLDRRPEEAMLDLLRENNISVIARGALAQGLLINKPPKDYLYHTMEDVAAAQALINGLVTEDTTATGIAMGYVLKNPAIACAVTGIRTEEQLQEALKAGDALSDKWVANLQQSVAQGVYEAYR